MSYLELLRLASPEAVLVVTALAVLTIGLVNERAVGACTFVAILGLALAIVAVLLLPTNASLFSGMLTINPLNSLFLVLCIGLSTVSVFLAQTENTARPSAANHGEYLTMLLLATIGLMLLVSSEELLMIFIGLELTGLSLYILTAFNRADVRSAEAGLKYFLFGSTASAFTLFGLSLIYGMSGTTSLAAITDNLANAAIPPLLGAGIIMTLVGLGFKIAAAPFHLWAPDVYQAAPVSSAAFIASASKVASFVVLGKILLIGFDSLEGSAAWHAMIAGWAPVIAVIAALSIIIGNLAALAQSNIRRLLAYSAVAHAGYGLVGLVVATPEGFSATLFYVALYAVTLVGAFAVVGAVRRQTGGDEIANFAGLASRSPLLASYMAIFMLSLAGLPPLPGFFGKFYLFSAALHGGENYGLLWLVAVGLLGSFVSLYYYLIVLKAIFVDETPLPVSEAPASSDLPVEQTPPERGERLVIGVLAAVVLLVGLMPQSVVARILEAIS
jgi:NADH-quinone oxidoreductase subunit N